MCECVLRRSYWGGETGRAEGQQLLGRVLVQMARVASTGSVEKEPLLLDALEHLLQAAQLAPDKYSYELVETALDMLALAVLSPLPPPPALPQPALLYLAPSCLVRIVTKHCRCCDRCVMLST